MVTRASERVWQLAVCKIDWLRFLDPGTSPELSFEGEHATSKPALDMLARQPTLPFPY